MTGIFTRLGLALTGLIASTMIVQAQVTGAIGARVQGLGQVSLQDKIGQMLIIGFPGTRVRQDWPGHVAGLIARGRIGGVLLFERNIKSPAQISALTRRLKAASPRLTPFIAVDQEGGRVERFKPTNGFASTPAAETLGREMDGTKIYNTYRAMARRLNTAGVNVNFGPVVDLSINPANRVIAGAGRAYGRDPEHVKRAAGLFVLAHRAVGILTAAKHFPGHGSSTADSHKVLADVSTSWQKQELEPFRYMAQEAAVDMIMVGHLYHPRFSARPGLPATFSTQAIEHHLRGKLGFKGLVVTDDLEMKAISGTYSFEAAVVNAVAAGNDLLVLSNQARPDKQIAARAIAAIMRAVRNGRIRLARIDSAYRRIVAAKRRLRLLSARAAREAANRPSAQ